MTARIGDGADTLARGIVTHANQAAQALGCSTGLACAEAELLGNDDFSAADLAAANDATDDEIGF